METLLQNWIIPNTIKSGCFGKGAQLDKFKIDETSDCTGDQFASEVVFVELFIRSAEGHVKSYPVIIKVQLQEPAFREFVNTTMQFENEILMYETILPMLDRNNINQEIFCKYYCGYVDPNDPSKDFIVLEDLRPQGYKLTKEKVFLDYEHCAAALKELGRFHALSYMQKSEDPQKLLSVYDKILDKWTPESIEFCQKMFQLCAKRGIQPLIDKGESVELLESLLQEYEDVVIFFAKLVKPFEPEAVLCHGDFNRNNMLFKYDKNQRVIGVKFIDLQGPRYAGPGIDLSFFICMNMSHSLRGQHLNDLLNVYHESLLATASNSIVPKQDLSRSAIFGFMVASFFLPMMMADHITKDEILGQGPGKGVEIAHIRGGHKETQAITEVIKDLLKFGLIRRHYD